MPAELTLAQREELTQDLHSLQTELEALLKATKEDSAPVELDQAAIGRVTRMDAIQQQQMARANRESANLRLRLVGQALRAVDADEYGECRDCGEPIGYRRLKAKPEAAFCVNCQGAFQAR